MKILKINCIRIFLERFLIIKIENSLSIAQNSSFDVCNSLMLWHFVLFTISKCVWNSFITTLQPTHWKHLFSNQIPFAQSWHSISQCDSVCVCEYVNANGLFACLWQNFITKGVHFHYWLYFSFGLSFLLRLSLNVKLSVVRGKLNLFCYHKRDKSGTSFKIASHLLLNLAIDID